MLDSFTIKNFKSFREAKLTLRPLTVMLGANASGKTNLLEALQLLSWIASGRQLGQVLSAVRDEELNLRGTLPQLTYDGSKEPIEFACWIRNPGSGALSSLMLYLDLAVDDSSGPRIDYEQLDAPALDTNVSLYTANGKPGTYSLDIFYNNFAPGKNPKISGNALQPVFTQLTTGARFAERHKRTRRLIPPATQTVSDSLQKILILDPVPRRMRGYSHALDTNLRSDGANVSAVLQALAEDEELPSMLEFIRALPEQDITEIGFLRTPRDEVMVQINESFGGRSRWREAALLSDGTLRAFAIAAALLSVEEGSTVVIEEVDNGIHPPRVGRIIELMREFAKRRHLRILITTHNPALLDAIPDSELRHVVACYRDPDEGDSRLVSLGELDRFPDLVAHGPLGTLVSKGVLDRFLKEKPEQRRAAAQRWLAGVRDGK